MFRNIISRIRNYFDGNTLDGVHRIAVLSLVINGITWILFIVFRLISLGII